MAGRIRDEDIALVRERTAIAEVISEHVTLKSAGGGNLKGLCPFHDEKTASFTVAPARGVYFCHGCGSGGDAIKFLMDLDHLSFVEAVEHLASRAGVALRYEDSGARPERPGNRKQRLVAAHTEAVQFYAEALLGPEAGAARGFLAERGFDRATAEHYGCGFAPPGWDNLTKYLYKRGYTSEELVAAGLSRPARSGSLIDRFRRRLMWPIRDIAGDTIGFGARKLFDDDDGPKYLNTPETPLYKKSHVLYGIDQAKREIAKRGRVVIVEGYTDVMACHLAGVPIAVATCGTAFGTDHINILRRLILDVEGTQSEIIFTFDGDAAGQKAALRAFDDDQRFVSQTFIAVSPDNMDPCELRMARGDVAVRDLIASREPLLGFALRSVRSRFDLDLVEGRVEALKATAPLVARIKDRTLRPEYTRKLAGDLGMEVEDVRRAVEASARGERIGASPRERTATQTNPHWRRERESLKIALQNPVLAGPMFDAVDATYYTYPPHVAIREGIAAAGGAASATPGPVWVERVRDECADLAGQALVSELAVEPILLETEPDPTYVEETLAAVQLPVVNRRVADLKSQLQRMNPVQNADEYMGKFGELVSVEQHARALRERAAGTP